MAVRSLVDKVESIRIKAEEQAEKRAKAIATQNALNTYSERIKFSDGNNLWVNFSNQITNAAHMLTLNERRIVVLAISKIDSKKEYENSIIPPLFITAAEYSAMFGVELNVAYNEMQLAAKKLMQRQVVLVKDPGDSDVINWCAGAKYRQREAMVAISFSHLIAPYISALCGSYTKYKLKQVSRLKSVYSWRLLEMLMQFQGSGWRIDKDIGDFIHAIGAKETYASNFAHLRKWVIEPAVRELTEKEGWKIEWQPRKSGRKVTGLRFDFKLPPALLTAIEENKLTEPEQPILDVEHHFPHS